jgi:hypothetical protein
VRFDASGQFARERDGLAFKGDDSDFERGGGGAEAAAAAAESAFLPQPAARSGSSSRAAALALAVVMVARELCWRGIGFDKGRFREFIFEQKETRETKVKQGKP